MATERLIAIRLWDWSEWTRQLVRGVQRFTHNKPDWRLYVDSRSEAGGRPLAMDVPVDGVITSVCADIKSWKRLIDSGRTKVVGVSAAIPSKLRAMPRVRMDDPAIARSIARHFIAGGFRRLAYFGTGDPPAEDERHAALAEVAQAEGLPFDGFLSKSKGPSGSNLPELRHWLARISKPTGVAVWNMDVARKVVEACLRLKLAVPEQVAVVAWDDDKMLAETFRPTISSVVLPVERLGYEAAKLLDRLLRGETPSAPVIVETTGVIHIRQSSDVSVLKDREVHLALQYIREHATEPMKIPQLAQAMRVSRKKLELDFARVLKQTPHQAIDRVRLDLAKQLLLETDWTLEKVANRAGLGTPISLRRLLVKYEKMTPGVYRSRFGTV